MPPEILAAGDEVEIADLQKVDIWSLGCIFFQILTGYQPF
jgi:serine/threonine protein kinase